MDIKEASFETHTVSQAVTEDNSMADSGNFAATPYPVYDTGRGDDDSVQTAVLVSHAGASAERNQDAGFSSLRAQMVNRDVLRSARDSDVAQLVAVKDSEIRRTEQFAELKSEISALRAESLGRDIASLRADLAESKGASQNDKILAVLAQIVAKLP